jgi:hypothetical protein
MHKKILTEEQIKLLPLAGKFMEKFGLVGGTAIALQIGHRRSIDFDMFSLEEFSNAKIKKVVSNESWTISKIYRDEKGQFTFIIGPVQMTFFEYPYKIEYSERLDKFFKMPDLLTLAAMKAHALGRRAKWKDYVDLYFIISKYHSIKKIVEKSREIFAGEFNERIFREQLGYFEDINYSEVVEFLPGFEVAEKTIKEELVKFSLE